MSSRVPRCRFCRRTDGELLVDEPILSPAALAHYRRTAPYRSTYRHASCEADFEAQELELRRRHRLEDLEEYVETVAELGGEPAPKLLAELEELRREVRS